MKLKTSQYPILITSVIGLASIMTILPTSALTYQDTVDVSFTLEPSVSITLSSSDLVINNLVPGQNSDSNVITLTAASNSPAGYTISSTVGNSTDFTNTNLKHSTDTSANPAKFTSLGTSDSVSNLANLTAGYWGYSFSLDGGTNWINATKTGNVNNTGYSGLPLYTTDAPAELLSVATSATSTIDFKIAAASTTTQAAGEYNNVINFITVAAPMPSCQTIVSGTMQEFNPCSNVPINTTGTLTDVRDNQEYTVAKLADGKWWTLDNLRLDPTTVSLATLQGNTNASNQTLTYFKNGGGSSPYTTTAVSNAWTSGSQNSYNLPYINAASKNTTVTSYGSGSGKVGVYYNYCAASAGSWCYAYGQPYSDPDTSTLIDAKEDLCPAGWRMPTGSSSGEFQALYTAYFNAVNFRNALSTPLSGYFYSGSAYDQGSAGYFWSSTYCPYSDMCDLTVDSGDVLPSNAFIREYGLSLRCLLSS